MLDFDITYIPGREVPGAMVLCPELMWARLYGTHNQHHAARAGLELQTVLLARIHPRLASSMMGRLAPAVPLTGLQHVKRLRKPPEAAEGQPCLELLLCALPHEAPSQAAGESMATYTPWTGEQASAAGAPEAVVQLVVEHGMVLRRGQVCVRDKPRFLPSLDCRIILPHTIDRLRAPPGRSMASRSPRPPRRPGSSGPSGAESGP